MEPRWRSSRTLAALLLLAALGLSACAGSPPAPTAAALTPASLPRGAPEVYPRAVPSFLQVGLASWYGDRFKHKPTASGERFDPNAMTAAHRSLPLSTIARVTNLNNGRHVLVRINDRGPYAEGRVIDLSRAAANKLGMKGDGIARVRVEVFAADQVKTVATRTPSRE